MDQKRIKNSLFLCVRSVRYMTEQLVTIVSSLNDRSLLSNNYLNDVSDESCNDIADESGDYMKGYPVNNHDIYSNITSESSCTVLTPNDNSYDNGDVCCHHHYHYHQHLTPQPLLNLENTAPNIQNSKASKIKNFSNEEVTASKSINAANILNDVQQRGSQTTETMQNYKPTSLLNSNLLDTIGIRTTGPLYSSRFKTSQLTDFAFKDDSLNEIDFNSQSKSVNQTKDNKLLNAERPGIVRSDYRTLGSNMEFEKRKIVKDKNNTTGNTTEVNVKQHTSSQTNEEYLDIPSQLPDFDRKITDSTMKYNDSNIFDGTKRDLVYFSVPFYSEVPALSKTKTLSHISKSEKTNIPESEPNLPSAEKLDFFDYHLELITEGNSKTQLTLSSKKDNSKNENNQNFKQLDNSISNLNYETKTPNELNSKPLNNSIQETNSDFPDISILKESSISNPTIYKLNESIRNNDNSINKTQNQFTRNSQKKLSITDILIHASNKQLKTPANDQNFAEPHNQEKSTISKHSSKSKLNNKDNSNNYFINHFNKKVKLGIPSFNDTNSNYQPCEDIKFNETNALDDSISLKDSVQSIEYSKSVSVSVSSTISSISAYDLFSIYDNDFNSMQSNHILSSTVIHNNFTMTHSSRNILNQNYLDRMKTINVVSSNCLSNNIYYKSITSSNHNSFLLSSNNYSKTLITNEFDDDDDDDDDGDGNVNENDNNDGEKNISKQQDYLENESEYEIYFNDASFSNSDTNLSNQFSELYHESKFNKNINNSQYTKEKIKRKSSRLTDNSSINYVEPTPHVREIFEVERISSTLRESSLITNSVLADSNCNIIYNIVPIQEDPLSTETGEDEYVLVTDKINKKSPLPLYGCGNINSDIEVTGAVNSIIKDDCDAKENSYGAFAVIAENNKNDELTSEILVCSHDQDIADSVIDDLISCYQSKSINKNKYRKYDKLEQRPMRKKTVTKSMGLVKGKQSKNVKHNENSNLIECTLENILLSPEIPRTLTSFHDNSLEYSNRYL